VQIATGSEQRCGICSANLRANGLRCGQSSCGLPMQYPRICRVCQQPKPLVEFPFRSRAEGTRHWICLACQRAAARSWYVARVPNANTAEGYGTFVRESLIARVDEYLSTHPCVDRGQRTIALLDFDHLRDKTANVSSMVRDGCSWGEIALEIAKCEVRCANCHARVTATRIGAYRLAAA
jgi:hypothetical protein